jgi:hypothetical protein
LTVQLAATSSRKFLAAGCSQPILSRLQLACQPDNQTHGRQPSTNGGGRASGS